MGQWRNAYAAEGGLDTKNAAKPPNRQTAAENFTIKQPSSP